MDGFADMIQSVYEARNRNDLSLNETAEMLQALADNYKWRSNEKLSEEVQKAIKEHGLPFTEEG